MRFKICIVAIIVILNFISCESAQVENNDQSNGKEFGTADEKILLEMINKINNNAPQSVIARFNINGFVNNKQYKTLGKALFSKDPKRANITILEYFFRSPLTIMFQEGDSVNLYMPVEKKIYMDNLKTFKLRNYSNIDLNYQLLYKLFTGSIPVLENYRIKKSVVDKSNNQKFLVLENNKYYETISFKNKIPDKLLFIDRFSKEKFEFYLSRPMKSGKSTYFKRIRFVANSKKVRLTVAFNYVKMNSHVKVKTLKQMRVPKSVTVIRVN